jgi:hypothetical protein
MEARLNCRHNSRHRMTAATVHEASAVIQPAGDAAAGSHPQPAMKWVKKDATTGGLKGIEPLP